MKKGDVDTLRYLEQKFKLSKLGKGGNIPDIIDLVTGISKINSFVTLYDFQQEKYIFHYNVKKNTGYSPNEFTIDAIRNAPQSPLKIVHVDDIGHKSRIEMLVMGLALENIKIKSLSEHVDTQFRIYTKNKQIIKVSRHSFMFGINEFGLPQTLLEKWKIIPHTDDYVKINLFSDDPKIEKIFYEKNRAVLNFNITNRQMEIVKLRNKRFDNLEVAKNLDISLKTVENHIRILKQNIFEYYQNNNINQPLKNMGDILHFVKTYFIFPL